MEEAGIVVCTWLHLVAMVIWLGHMINSLILFEPLTEKYVVKTSYGDFIAEYRRRDRPVAISCIVLFIVTGVVLTLLNEQYEGFGSIFANSWSIVLFVKHILVLAMFVLGIYQGTRVMPGLAVALKRSTIRPNNKESASAVVKLEKMRKRVTLWLSGLALLVLLLTAVGEVV